MQPHLKRKIAAASAVALAISVTGGAVASTSAHTKKASVKAAPATGFSGSGSTTGPGPGVGFGRGPGGPGPGGPGGDDFAAAADYLGLTTTALQSDLQGGQTLAQVAGSTSGKTVDGLVAALVAAEKTELDGRVSSGQLTQAQEDTIVPTLTQRFTDFVNGTGRPGPGPGGPGGPGGDDFAAAASYLGLTTAALQSDLQGGQTLAQVAGSTSGKTVDGLVAALVAAEKTELDGRVSSGQLTQAQEDTIVPTLTQRFTDFVNGTGRPGPGH